MWILILVVVTAKGEFIPYEQGIYDTWRDCHETKKVLLEEMGNRYRATCLEWR